MTRWTTVALLALVFCATATAGPILLSNGLGGTDQYSVSIDENAYSTVATIQAPGQGPENLMYQYIGYIDIGGTSVRLGGGAWIDSDASDGTVMSGGTTNGISWTATHTLPAGGTIMTSRYTLSLPGAVLPSLRFFQYLDEDVYSISNNILVVGGSIPGGDLELLTVHPTIKAGVSQSGDAQATGWGADVFDNLRSDLDGGGYNAAPGGTIQNLPFYVDPFFGPAYGPRDITTVLEWEVQGGQQSFTFEAYLGGVPEAGPVIPEPGTIVLLGAGLIGLAVFRRRRK